MPFAVNRVVDREEYTRHNCAERHYMDSLRERGLLVEIENVAVDADQLVLRTFQCDSGYCVRCSGEGAQKKVRGSCCTDLQVDITQNEEEKLVELARLADEKLEFTPNDPVK